VLDRPANPKFEYQKSGTKENKTETGKFKSRGRPAEASSYFLIFFLRFVSNFGFPAADFAARYWRL